MSEEKKLTPIKAIRVKCIDCMAGKKSAVKNCETTDCSLYPYRLGKNPYINKKPMSDEQKAKAAERLAVARSKR